jgi:hypothetical protein
MLKGVLVILSLVFCAGALVVPPSARGAAEWSGVVLQDASSLGRSALSVVLRAMPSSGEVARYAGEARLLAERVVENALRNFREPAPAPAAEPQPPIATRECRPGEQDDAWCDPRVQAVLRQVENERVRRGESASPL